MPMSDTDNTITSCAEMPGCISTEKAIRSGNQDGLHGLVPIKEYNLPGVLFFEVQQWNNNIFE